MGNLEGVGCLCWEEDGEKLEESNAGGKREGNRRVE